MHLGCRHEQSPQHGHLLRIEEDETVEPDLCPVEQRRFEDGLSKLVHHVLGIVGLALHLRREFIRQERHLLQLARKALVALGELFGSFAQHIRRQAVALELLDGVREALREAALAHSTRKDIEVLLLLMLHEDFAQEQAASDVADARHLHMARLQEHVARKAAEAEDVAAQEAAALRDARGELALHLERHVFRQEQDERGAHRCFCHALPHGIKAGMRLACPRSAYDEIECCCHIVLNFLPYRAQSEPCCRRSSSS